MEVIILIVLIVLIVLNIYISIKNQKYLLRKTEFYDNKHPTHRYSSVNGKCIKTTKYLGNDILGVPIKGYQSKDECMANNDICQQYSKEKCIKQTKCGYCSYKNKGMCLSATPDGPKILDYKCQQSGSKSNRFTMGQPDEHIPPNINVDKYPITLPHPNIAPDYNLSPMI